MRRYPTVFRRFDTALSAVLTASLMAGLGVLALLGPVGVVETHLTAATSESLRAACGTPRPGWAQCMSLFRPDRAAQRATAKAASPLAARPAGLGADALRSAYRLPVTRGTGRTIGIVDAYDDPNAEHDLAVYRRKYGLPACTTANGCLHKVNENGKATPLPSQDPGWAVEISLDLDMVSAGCPRCGILLVESDDPSFDSLGKGVDTAVRLGATAVSNSYGAPEFSGAATFAHYYDHPGHAITVSSDDEGFGPASFPAVLASVTAVGGTTLTKVNTARGWREAAWNLAGSGCSAYVAKPVWQHDGHCGKRTVADVSAVADDLAVYDTLAGAGLPPGWLTVGGTSASSPLIAAVYGLAGNPAATSPGYLYAHRTKLFDVTTGSNAGGRQCGGDYLCTAKPGYDGPTGLGTPDGIGAF
jgi:hypothetical protein